jgi:hypothetical protein
MSKVISDVFTGRSLDGRVISDVFTVRSLDGGRLLRCGEIVLSMSLGREDVLMRGSGPTRGSSNVGTGSVKPGMVA